MTMIRFGSFIKALFQTIFSILKILIKSGFAISNKTSLKNSDKNIVILANGPSLKETIALHRDFLDSNDLLCVNAFSMSEEFTILKPRYYVIADPQFWLSNPIEGVDDYCQNILKAIIQKVDWDMVLFTPYESRKYSRILQFRENKNIKIEYYNKTPIAGFTWFVNFCFNKNLGIPSALNVLIPSLILSVNLNYAKVYITGADHSWTETLVVDDKNVLCIRDEHFYDQNKNRLRPIKDIYTGKKYHLHEQLQALAIVFKIYFIIEDYAQSRNAVIFNASEKSYIDAFRRVKI